MAYSLTVFHCSAPSGSRFDTVNDNFPLSNPHPDSFHLLS